jgi:hypothetical protein
VIGNIFSAGNNAYGTHNQNDRGCCCPMCIHTRELGAYFRAYPKDYIDAQYEEIATPELIEDK